MDAPFDRRRLRLAAAVAFASGISLAALMALSSGSAAAGPGTLKPDLVTLSITRQDLVVQKIVRRKLLRLSNEIGNRGPGPLEIVPGTEGEPGGCPEGQFEAIQRLFSDTNGSGLFERGSDTFDPKPPFGCMRYHDAAGHQHWHVLDFARYELIREGKGTWGTSRKIGFCVINSNVAFPDLPGFDGSSQEREQYLTGCGGPGEAPSREGLSIGYSDLYFYGLAGQSLKLNHLGRGRYCLTSTADPEDLIDEANENNNQRRVRLKLRPRKLRVRVLRGACRV